MTRNPGDKVDLELDVQARSLLTEARTVVLGWHQDQRRVLDIGKAIDCLIVRKVFHR